MIDRLSLKLLIFIGILQVLRYDFQKFRILEILNFHSCKIFISPQRKIENTTSTKLHVLREGLEPAMFGHIYCYALKRVHVTFIRIANTPGGAQIDCTGFAMR